MGRGRAARGHVFQYTHYEGVRAGCAPWAFYSGHRDEHSRAERTSARFDRRLFGPLFDELIVCGLENLETNNANCTCQGITKYRLLNSGSDNEFTRTVAFLVHVLVADGAGANGVMKKFEEARRRRPRNPLHLNTVLKIWCQCHTTHLAQAEQSTAYQVDKQFCLADEPVAAPPAPKAVPKPKPKAKKKGKAVAVAIPIQKKRAPRAVTFISSMTRGSHLLGFARVWKKYVESVGDFVEFKLECRQRAPTPEEASAIEFHREKNRLLLQRTVLECAPAKSKRTLQEMAEELVQLIGGCPWDAGSPMVHWTSGDEMQLDAVNLMVLRAGLLQRITVLVRGLFLRRKPGRPEVSRWTGVAQCSLWHASNLLFFKMEVWILQKKLKWDVNAVPVTELERQATEGDVLVHDNPETARKYLGARRALYLKFLTSGSAELLALAFVFTNSPVRQVLHFLFASSYESRNGLAPVDKERLERLWEKYLLDPARAFNVEDGQGVPSLVVWASGAVTGRALQELSNILLEVDPQKTVQTMVTLLGCEAPEEFEKVHGMIRRSSSKGAIQVWHRMHLPTKNFDMKAFKVLDPSRTVARRAEIIQDLRRHWSCCGGAMGEDLSIWVNNTTNAGHTEKRIFAHLSDGLRNAAAATIPVTHIIERDHGETHKDVRACKQLGHAAGGASLSADHVIRSHKREHKSALDSKIQSPGTVPRKRGCYARCEIKKRIVKFKKRVANRKKILEPKARRTGFTQFRRHYNTMYWPAEKHLWQNKKPYGNKSWHSRVLAAWRALSDEEKAEWSGQARRLNDADKAEGAQGDPAGGEDAPARQRLPLCMGDQNFAVSVSDVAASSLLKTEEGIIGSCKMIMDNPDLQAEMTRVINDNLGKVFPPCWELGFCRSRCAHSLPKIMGVHMVMQRSLLNIAGVPACRSGDLLVYCRGHAKGKGGTPGVMIEVFAMLTCQSLLPKKSLFTLLTVPGRVDEEIEDCLYQKPMVDNKMPELPTSVLVIGDTKLWRFQISTGLACSALYFHKKYELNWDISILNYTHKSSNELLIKNARVTKNWFGMDVPITADCDDPIDLTEFSDPHSEDARMDAEVVAEFAAMEEAMAASMTATSSDAAAGGAGAASGSSGPPAPPPPVPPPAVVLPPTPPLEVKKNTFWIKGQAKPIGKLTLLVAWSPPSFSMKCYHHVACSMTGDCNDVALELLKQWVAAGHLFLDSHSHKEAKPSGLRTG